MAQYYLVKTNENYLKHKNIIKDGKLVTAKGAAVSIIKWDVGSEDLQLRASRGFRNAVISNNEELQKLISDLEQGKVDDPLIVGNNTYEKKLIKIESNPAMVNHFILYKHLVWNYDNSTKRFVPVDEPNLCEFNLILDLETYKTNVESNKHFKELHKEVIKELRRCHDSIKSVENRVNAASDDDLIEYFLNLEASNLNIARYLPDIVMNYLPDVDSTLSEEAIEMIAEAGATSWDNCLKALESKTGDWTKYWSANMTDRPTFHCLGKFCELLNRSAIYEMLNRYVKDAI